MIRDMRFIQFADVHLDSAVGGALRLPDEKRAALRRDIRSAFAAACALAADRRVDLALIPGDVFDYESADDSTTSFIIDSLCRMAPIPVFIAPGNHDSLRPSSPYLPGEDGAQWPDNVRVFTSQTFETVRADRLDCSVTGVAHAHRGIADRLLSRPLPPADAAINILMFHGSREGWRPSDKEAVIPFSDDELLAQPFTYSAVGHYHSFSEIKDSEGRLRAAYSGCVQGRGLDEAGEKCVLLGEIDGAGRVDLEKVEVAPRRIVCVEANVTGCRDAESVLRAIDTAASVARERDIVNVSLTGVLPSGLDLDLTTWESAAPFFHARVDPSGVEPDYDLESISSDPRAAPLRAEFVRRMLRLEAEAQSEDEKRVLRDAIHYGLRALDSKKLEPRDAR